MTPHHSDRESTHHLLRSRPRRPGIDPDAAKCTPTAYHGIKANKQQYHTRTSPSKIQREQSLILSQAAKLPQYSSTAPIVCGRARPIAPMTKPPFLPLNHYPQQTPPTPLTSVNPTFFCFNRFFRITSTIAAGIFSLSSNTRVNTFLIATNTL
ncbi:hypothetical protein KC19_1G000100 [Ceratodon purpureus]|uniref:Uncharacterized protein n=1 Tax=Ceratodon purpureus TaxID=3225 RepID=A0A8T0IZL1_CERPU|nr:hypothetical protein KC19_1G000100 [Ceratodon purpureus]